MKCEECEYKQINPDGGWCYMFKEKFPNCQQFKSMKDCRRCGWWRNRNSTRKGVSIPDGTGKCTRPEGHCDPDIVKGKIGEGAIVRHTTAN